MSVSVIIPTLNEASYIEETIRALRIHEPHEILVADGGSNDATRQRASEADAVLEAPRGRAVQMNHAAAQATGDVLLFLHADCRLEDGALAEAAHWLERRDVIAGCFQMTVDAGGWLYRCIDACATARVRLTGLAYGDQGLFVRRHDFQRLHGFPRLALMEDLVFSRTLRQAGRIVVARSRIRVSPRRWQRQGLVRQTLRNWSLTALAAAGISPNRLAAFYPVIR